MRKNIVTILLFVFSLNVWAQNKFTREQVLSMTEDQLMDLSIEDFAEAIKAAGVSNSDELFAMIMNKNVSSASKEEENAFTSPLSSTVITKQEMRTYGVSTIEEAFRLIPGMIVTEKTNGIYDIHMRGLNNIPDNNTFLYTENANTLLMIDGRPVQNNVMGSINFDMLPIGMEDIERIEVVRGACGALYGANAVNGVINIITERPSEVSSIASGHVQVGNNSTFIGELGMRKALNSKIAIGFTANIQKRERGTDKLYLIPNAGQYIPTRSTPELPNAGDRLDDLTVLGTMIDASNGGEFTLEEIQSMKQLYVTTDGGYRIFDGTEPETPLTSMFPNVELSRETMGLNGYLCLTPTDNANIFASFGYQKSHVNGSPANEDIVSLNGRKSETAYVNLDANIKDLHFVASYMNGLQEYVVGVPGYKMDINNINISGEYNFRLGNGFTVKPGIFFQHTCASDYVPVWDEEDPVNAAIADAEMANNMGFDLSDPGFRSNYKWHYEKPSYGFDHADLSSGTNTSNGYTLLSGLFTGEKDINTIAPSIRADYHKNGLRIIGAYRADKTSNPDKWSHSWQLATSYEINDDNFVRFVYGRANRGANLVNSCADYTWFRSNMYYPNKLRIIGNEDLTLMHIDNFEIGYRTRPSKRILIDAEAFYSISKDYGAMMANYGAMQASSNRLGHILTGIYNSVNKMPDGIESVMFSNPQFINYMANYIFFGMAQQVDMGKILMPFADVKYQMLPYEVHQMGLSYNIDFIISPKLIAKFNGNIQKTYIDNYFEYQQINDIKNMLSKSEYKAVRISKPEFTPEQSQMLDIYVPDPTMNYIFKNYQINGEMADMLNTILTQWRKYHESGMEDAYAIQKAAMDAWSDIYNVEEGICEFGMVNGNEIRNEVPQEKRDGYKHEGTPTFYGMMGLIYKPIEKIEVAAFFNYIGPRTYKLAYGSFDMKNRATLNLKVGYKPVKGFEVFFNGHNLFNNKQRECVMNDKIGGLYTVGATFNF